MARSILIAGTFLLVTAALGTAGLPPGVAYPAPAWQWANLLAQQFIPDHDPRTLSKRAGDGRTAGSRRRDYRAAPDAEYHAQHSEGEHALSCDMNELAFIHRANAILGGNLNHVKKIPE